jgi:hypothetical protein
MSKKYKDKTCAYCAASDHGFGRDHEPGDRRGETPKKKEAPAMPGGGMGGMDY